MSFNTKVSNNNIDTSKYFHFISFLILFVLVLVGCRTVTTTNTSQDNSIQSRVLELEIANSKNCIGLLSQFGFKNISVIKDTNNIAATGSFEELRRLGVIIDLIDSKEEYITKNIGPASIARILPPNNQIAQYIGNNIEIGTFINPPKVNGNQAGIIDIHNDKVMAILPISFKDKLNELFSGESTQIETVGKQPDLSLEYRSPTKKDINTQSEHTYNSDNNVSLQDTKSNGLEITEVHDRKYSERLLQTQTRKAGTSTTIFAMSEMYSPDDMNTQTVLPEEISLPEIQDESTGEPLTVKIGLKPIEDINTPPQTISTSKVLEIPNGEDNLELALPETMTLMDMLNLVGKNLKLNYVYDPGTIGKQSVSLKMHGSNEGKMKVKDLYSLLETVLKNHNLAMIRRDDNFVNIVPTNQVMEVDPQLVDVTNINVQAGDTVVTCIFELRYVDVESVTSLLQTMKLAVSVLPIKDSQVLFVTCYAHRIERIEELISMLDKPGEPKECRIRRLQYSNATVLLNRVRTLAKELRDITIITPSSGGATASKQGTDQLVLIDVDETMNRIFMIGQDKQLTIIEELIDILDVTKKDTRIIRFYTIHHMKAQEILTRLNELEILNSKGGTPKNSGNPALSQEPIVIAVEATNKLLIKAEKEQHTQIQEFLRYFDVSPQDLRVLQYYPVYYIDAASVKRKLEELKLTGPSSISVPDNTNTLTKNNSIESVPDVLIQKPEVVVNESTNSLFINATAQQHDRISTILSLLDVKKAEEELSYKIYPLINSSPEHVAGLLQKLIQKNTRDKEDKIENLSDNPDQIMVVPDPNTFSLIIHATQRDHEWIKDLTKSLDKRRPQVLIDVTLVEVTRTDTFEYDLNLITNAKDSVIGNTVLTPLQTSKTGSILESSFNMLDSDGNPSGMSKVFYSDDKVQALLSAIRRKNYGRVLAQPKILVDDGRRGEISTIDQTTFSMETVQIPDQGAPITTRNYETIEAKLQLKIVPHIGEGNLLRLEVNMSREDFGTRPAEGAPPDKATSEIGTTVFVPDDNTVILGGLVKLNQSKGGSKIPILGDLPLIGFLFRSVDKSDVEKKLYVFLKANIVRPFDDTVISDLENISKQHRDAFEKSETEFQEYENIPGLKPIPMQPEKVLNDYK